MSASPATPFPARPLARRWLGPALAVTGALVIVALVGRAGPSAVWQALARVGPGFAAILVAPLGGLVLHCWGWLSLMPAARRPSLPIAIGAYIAAQAGDELAMGIGGEPLKALVVPGSGRARAAATVVLDNAAQLIALGIFLLVVALLASAWSALVPIGLGLAAAGLALPRVLADLLRRTSDRVRWPWLRRLARIAGLAGRAFHARPRRMLAAVGLHLFGRVWIIPEMALALLLLRSSAGPAVLLGSVSVAASVVGAFIPGQAGVVEAALAASGALLGMEPSTVMALALLRRIRGMVWIALGLLLAGKVIEHGRSEAAASRGVAGLESVTKDAIPGRRASATCGPLTARPSGSSSA
jgi:hypothetical protein